MATDIESQLVNAGIMLFGKEKSQIEELILNILQSGNTRYLKMLPSLIYIHKPNLDDIFAKTSKRGLFSEIIDICKIIFEKNGINIDIHSIGSHNSTLNIEEFLQEFELQKRNYELTFLQNDFDKEREYNFSMSHIFTTKEIQIIKKILNERELTKTEYEYYSRKTKKKIAAIQMLGDLPNKTLLKDIKVMLPEIIDFKRQLEELLTKEKKSPCSIYSFSRFNHDQIIIRFDCNKSHNNTIRDISKLGCPLDLLEERKEYYF